MWKSFITNQHQFAPHEPEYRKVCFLNSILALMVTVLVVMTALNIVFFTSTALVVMNAGYAVLGAGIVAYFKHTHRVHMTAWITVLLLVVGLIFYFHIKGPADYSLVWVIGVPPVAYFLLGRQQGRIVTIGFLAYMLVLILWRFEALTHPVFTMDAVYNIAAAALAITLVIAYYEITRSEAETMLKLKNQELVHLSSTDRLTGLTNRLVIDEVLSTAYGRSQRMGEVFSVIIADIDHFKQVNDQYGHLAGDELLVWLAGVLRNSCREMDTIGRWGGEEFLVICPNTGPEGARALAERIQQNVSDYCTLQDEAVTLSIGVASSQWDDTTESVVKRADLAMYRAKEKGRNRVETA